MASSCTAISQVRMLLLRVGHQLHLLYALPWRIHSHWLRTQPARSPCQCYSQLSRDTYRSQRMRSPATHCTSPTLVSPRATAQGRRNTRALGRKGRPRRVWDSTGRMQLCVLWSASTSPSRNQKYGGKNEADNAWKWDVEGTAAEGCAERG